MCHLHKQLLILMQGQKGGIDSLPESLAMEHGSASTDSSVVEQQICWTNFMRHPPVSTIQGSQNVSMWSMGESSSSSIPTHVSQNCIEPTTEHGWSSLMKPCPEPQQHEPLPSMLSMGDVHMNITHNHANSAHHAVPHNVTVNPATFIGIKPSNYATTSSDPFEMANRRLPYKRKAADLTVGQSSSGIESSNIFQRPEGSTSAWRLVSENPSLANSMPYDPSIPRLGLGVGGVSSDNRDETARRNVRIRINNSHQQDSLPSNIINNRQINFSSPHPSLGDNPIVMRAPTVDNSSSQVGQPVLRVPALRNVHLSSRNRSSSSRTSRSSNINSGSGDNSRTMPMNISDHPLFLQPPRDIRNASPTAINWSLSGNNANGVASTSNSVQAAPSSAPPNVAPPRGSAHYSSRRLSEIFRQSLLSSNDSGAGVVGGGQTSNLFSRLPPPVRASQQAGNTPPVIGHHRHHLAHQRSSDRYLNAAAFGFPFLARAAGSEGRGRLASEIRNVLDLLRRGEGLRIEDVMLLDQSVLYGMVDIQDRHRDMRLDIDNMSYEELLALEERIGNVNTGLSEENISSCLKQKTFVTVAGQPDTEPCCICQDEYKNGDDLGSLKCGHDFHTNCIKQWLLQKNSCPVCKSAASATTK